ncbi:MAG: sortase, partial [Chloroflexi bacterium]
EAVNGNALPRDLPGWWKWRDDVTTYPGTQTQTSVWIFGHAQSSPSMVFNPLMTTVVGDRVVLTTSAGKLAYQVQDEPFLVLKDQMSNRKDVFTSHPGRLVLVTCNVEGGQDTLYNRVVFAQLM